MQEIGQIGEEAVRRIIRTVQECSDVVKYHRRQASKKTIQVRKKRNLSFPNRSLSRDKRRYMKYCKDLEESFYHTQETDQN